MLTQRPTPAFMSQEAARRLPRFALALLLAVFILSSFWADGLWTLRDAAGFGVAQSMTNGGLEAWLLPQIQGTPEAEIGPLAGWAAALFMKLFSELLGEIGAYRLTSVFWFLFTSVAVLPVLQRAVQYSSLWRPLASPPANMNPLPTQRWLPLRPGRSTARPGRFAAPLSAHSSPVLPPEVPHSPLHSPAAFGSF